MEQPSKPFAGLAEVLLAQGAAGEQGTTRVVARVEHVYAALFAVSAPVLGADGTRALLARSVKLTRAQFPALASITTGPASPDSPPVEQVVFAGLAALEPAVTSELVVVLFANLLGLMATFIGERLVLQLLKSAFPAMSETGLEESE